VPDIRISGMEPELHGAPSLSKFEKNVLKIQKFE
jgi:hypothetical protein